MDCEPRHATPRTRRRSEGPQAARTARRVGVRLMPWQRLALTTGLEQWRGRPAYRDVYVSVPRQQGKTVLVLALIMHVMESRPGSVILYGAQTRVAARRKMLLSWWPLLRRSPMAADLTLFRGFGNESITHANGSVLELMSAAESAGHGDTCDLAVVDEAWVHQDAAHEQALRPAMVTRPRAQLWALSTAGTHRSVWWRQKLDAGIAAAEMGVDSGVACLDWSAPPGANPADEAVWQACMPALGRTIDVETVRADLANMGVKEFSRAYCNIWPDPRSEGWQYVDESDWRAARGQQ